MQANNNTLDDTVDNTLQSTLSLVSQPIIPIQQAMPQLRKSKLKHKKLASAINPLLLDKVVGKEIINEEFSLISKTKRFVTLVHNETFLSMVLDALKNSKYHVEHNNRHHYPQHALDNEMNATKNFTYHAESHRILVKVVAVKSDVDTDPFDIIVDICGVRGKKGGTPLVFACTEHCAWVNRVLQLARQTHVPCITTTCNFCIDKEYIPDDGHIICPECKTDQCMVCEVPYELHIGLTCNEYRIKRDVQRIEYDPIVIEELQNGTMQLCPKCHTCINRIDGCNKICCTNQKCKTYWCWACAAYDLQLKYDDPYKHYSDDYKGFDGMQTRCPAQVFSNVEQTRLEIAARNVRLLAHVLHYVEQPVEQQAPP